MPIESRQLWKNRILYTEVVKERTMTSLLFNISFETEKFIHFCHEMIQIGPPSIKIAKLLISVMTTICLYACLIATTHWLNNILNSWLWSTVNFLISIWDSWAVFASGDISADIMGHSITIMSFACWKVWIKLALWAQSLLCHAEMYSLWDVYVWKTR